MHRNSLLVFTLIVLFSSLGALSQTLSDTVMLKPAVIFENSFKKMPVVTGTIKSSEIDKLASGDIGYILRTIPNVSAIRKGGTNLDPVVRGFKYSQINTQINNGIHIEGGCPNRMDPTSSHIDINDIGKIEVLKGPYSLRYGPNFGGVINYLTIQPVGYKKFETHVRGLLSYESNGGGAKQHITVDGGNNNFYYIFTGNNLNYGNYKDGDGNIIKSSFNKYSYSGKAGYVLHNNHRFELSYLGSNSSNVLFPALPMDERSDNTKIMAVDYNCGNIGKNINLIGAKIYRTDVHHIMDNKLRSNSDTVVAVSDVHAINTGGKAEIGLKFKEKFFLIVGGDYLNTYKDGTRTKTMIMQPPKDNNIPSKLEKLWNNACLNNTGIYSEFRTSVRNWDLLATIRCDLNSAKCDPIVLKGTGTPPPTLINDSNTSSNYTNFSFNLGVTKNFNDNISLSLTIGRGMRSPNMTERFIILLPVGYDNYDYLGNPQLKPEINNEADLIFKYNIEKVGSFELTGFYSYVQDFIMGMYLPASVQKPLTQGVLGVKQYENTNSATFTGFEFAYATPTKYKFGATLTAAYTYATGTNITMQILDPTKIVSQQVIGEQVLSNDAMPEIPPFEANIGIYYKFFKNKLIPKVSYRLVLAQNHISQAFYESKTPGFNIFNASITYNLNKYFSVTGGCNNIFNVYYYEHLNRRIVGTTTNLYEPGRNLFVNLIFNI